MTSTRCILYWSICSHLQNFSPNGCLVPGFEELLPLRETPVPPTDLEQSYLSPTATQKPSLSSKPTTETVDTTAAAPPRELPPDIWLPVPDLQSRDPRLPNSKFFLSDFPPHRGRSMLSEKRGNTAGLRTAAYTHFSAIASTLLVIFAANLLG